MRKFLTRAGLGSRSRPLGTHGATSSSVRHWSLVIIQLGLRAWSLFTSWFYLDDYNLLLDAQSALRRPDYLLDPYNSHLMPGRPIASPGPSNPPGR